MCVLNYFMFMKEIIVIIKINLFGGPTHPCNGEFLFVHLFLIAYQSNNKMNIHHICWSHYTALLDLQLNEKYSTLFTFLQSRFSAFTSSFNLIRSL